MKRSGGSAHKHDDVELQSTRITTAGLGGSAGPFIPVNWRRPLKQVLVVLHSYVCRQNNWLCLHSAIFENADSGTDEAGPRCQSLPYPRHESKPGPLSAPTRTSRPQTRSPKPATSTILIVVIIILEINHCIIMSIKKSGSRARSSSFVSKWPGPSEGASSTGGAGQSALPEGPRMRVPLIGSIN